MSNILFMCIKICTFVLATQKHTHGSNKKINLAGPQAICPQNLARANINVKTKGPNALKNVGSFQYLMYERYYKNQIWP